MKRVLTTVLTAGLLLMAVPAHAYENRYNERERSACRFQRNDRWNDAEVRDTIRCASRHFGVATTTAIRVARCESRFKSDAVGATGTYRGVYQHSRNYWGARQNAADRHNRWNIAEGIFNARANVIVTMRMVRSGGWGPWACY